MPEYVLQRNHILSNPHGVVVFTKGQPVYVTPNMEKFAAEIGALRVDGDTIDPLGEEVKKPAPLTGDEREAQVFLAFELLVENNDSKDFTGQGVPRVKSVERITSMNFEQGELITLWQKYKQAKVDEQ